MEFNTANQAEAWGCRMLKRYFPADYVAAGWSLRVWENIGWHVAFAHGQYVDVHWCDRAKKFWCLIGIDGGGRSDWTPNSTIYHKDPVKVVRRTLQFARQRILDDVRRYNDTAAGICREKLSLRGN